MESIIYSKISDKIIFEQAAKKVYDSFPGEEFSVLTSSCEERESVHNIIELTDDEGLKSFLTGKTLKRVILLGFERTEILPITWIVEFLSHGADAISGLYDGAIGRYSPFKGYEANTILVFPGSMLPLSMGSHQRSFLLLAALNYSGYYTDVIITGGNSNALSRARRLLSAIAPNVYIFKNNKRKLPDALWLRREIERKYRKLTIKDNKVPELFADRYSNKATESLKITLARLHDENEYKNIIVSYAWMTKCLDYIPDEKLKETTLICDTHDVQFVRNLSANKHEKRFMSLQKYDKWLEKKVLARYDYIGAISKSDSKELRKHKELAKKVINVTSAFNYALKKPRKIGHKPCLHYGFIGGGMDANVKALAYILDEWWPVMNSYSPNSKFYIAGSICRNPLIASKVFFDESIVKMGFVDSISDFYDKIDISLNPVLVQGGLNFKSVEAVLAGKLLITNQLGSQCLGETNIATIADTQKEFLDIVQKIEIMPGREFNQLLEVRQKRALEEFGEATAYNELKKVLVS